MALNYTQAQLQALTQAYASGTLRVSYDGKSVEYRSLNELKSILDEVSAALSGTSRRRTFRTRTSGDRGL